MRFAHRYLCWIDVRNPDNVSLVQAVAKEITPRGATFVLQSPTDVPLHCAFYFTRDRQVGRRCRRVSQNNLEVTVAFEGRLGVPANAVVALS